VVEAAVCELRRAHPRWGARWIEYELGRNGCPGRVPSRMTIYRILLRHGLVAGRKRGRRRDEFVRWQRDKPMELWQVDIVGGVLLADGTEAKVVTGVDDHSRHCVMAKVVARATGRAVCLAFAEALQRFGVPEEVLSDNGKQFTDRFGKGGEVLFDRICRENAIVHRLTQPAHPTMTGKVERFHGSLRRELLNDITVFDDVAAAQTAIDRWVAQYNGSRPHQSLDMAVPADRFRPNHDPAELPLRLPATLQQAHRTSVIPEPRRQIDDVAEPSDQPWSEGPIEFDRVVPPSGNMQVAGKQFWLGPDRAGVTVTFWADTDVIHVLIAGVRVKSVRSHLSVNDIAVLARQGGRAAGPSPLPSITDPGGAVEVDRTVSNAGTVSLGQHIVLAAEILGGRRVGIRVDEHTLMFFDPETRELLRTRPNPLTAAEILKLRSARPAGPVPQPRTDPVRVQRRASNSGVVMVAWQKVALGRVHAHQTITIDVSETELIFHCDDGVRTVRRTNNLPVSQIKAQRPRKRSGDDETITAQRERSMRVDREYSHAAAAVVAAIAAVDNELARHAAGHGRAGNPTQLTQIRGQLHAILSQLENHQLPPPESRLRGLGRTISDSWPLSSEPGTLIMRAEQLYLELA
jgi:transposase InsO family protein